MKEINSLIVTYCRQFILNIFNIFIKTITILITIVKRCLEKKDFQVFRVALNGSSVCNSENVFTLSVHFWPLRNICGGQWKGQIRRILAWKSTSVGRWTARPRLILQSIQSIYAQEEQ